MRWQQWGVIFNKGKRAIIRIIDNSTTGHLNVDDFRFYDNHFLGHEVTIGGKKYPAWIEHESHYYYWDSPVWGFADLHAHPMSYLGFGHFVMHGELDGNIESALENCRCRHGGSKRVAIRAALRYSSTRCTRRPGGAATSAANSTGPGGGWAAGSVMRTEKSRPPSLTTSSSRPSTSPPAP